MNQLTCSPAADRPTTILIGAGLRFELEKRVAEYGEGRRVISLVDQVVEDTYPNLLPSHWLKIPLSGGEDCKTFEVLERVLRQMIGWKLDRSTILVAVGGGTVGDLGGLVASLFLRGIELVQVPTTLVAMLDSSVGGKTAINVPEGKNLVGTYKPASLMLSDVELLSSLPREHLLSGLGEAIKMGIGFNRELFALLESQAATVCAGDPALLTEVVTMAVGDKIATVEADPHETTGRRRCLNLGHTLAHALEASSNFSILHGHAVAQGLHFALDVATTQQAMTSVDTERCHALIDEFGFARQPLPAAAQLLEFFTRDKKMEKGILHFVLPTGIGACKTVTLRPEDLIPQ